MELEAKRVQVIRTGRAVGRMGGMASAVFAEMVFTTPDADGARRFTIPISNEVATEFERMVVRATPMEKL